MSGHGVTERDVSAMVHLVSRLRQETHGANIWDGAGIHAKVKELLGQNLEITLERVLRHAADPEAKTPGAIHRAFLPPAASEKPAQKRGNPHRHEECPRHPGQWPDTCAGCKNEPLGAEIAPADTLPKLADVNPRLAQRLAARRQPEDN